MFKKNQNIIDFIFINEYYKNVIDTLPAPATKYVPDWWKKMEPYSDNKLKIQGKFSSATGKKCMPMLDSITSGYIVPLWADVLVLKNQNGHTLSWKTDEAVFGVHDSRQSDGVEGPEEYAVPAYKYHNPWVIRTNPGWSCLITAPNGYHNLPFKIIPGIVDTDVYPQEINPVFWIKKDFEGIIEKGTPMYQVIPIKREKWEMKISSYEKNEQHYYNQEKNMSTTIVNNYIKNIWQKKEYK
jgi:hypothetical protein